MTRFGRLMVVMLASISASWSVAHAESAEGIVYNDANSNGKMDSGERGIPGVLVSNGVDVVPTDKNGSYAIPISDDTIVFVIKPRGWMTPVGPGNNVPRFYYIHRPNGSPKMTYAGVAPTGPLPASIDFPLRRQRERNRFRVICMGDTQTRNLEEVQFVAHDFLDELAGTDAAFGVTLGDSVFNDLTVFEPLVTTMSSLGVPWRYVLGNHDLNYDSPSGATPDTFERMFGPSYYAFNYGPVHFIVLNTIPHDYGQRRGYRGHLGEQQLEFVKNDLAHVSPKQLVVLMMHIPLTQIDDARALYALLKDLPHTFSLSAHLHTQGHMFLGKDDGWMQETPHHHLHHGAACGCLWGGSFDEVGIPTAQMSDGGPNNYSFITFEGTKYDVEFRVPRRPADYQMNISLPDRIPAGDAANTTVVANIFAGSAKSRVEMSVDGATGWTAMAPSVGQDPYLAQAFDRQNAFVAKIAELSGTKEGDKTRPANQIMQDFSMFFRSLLGPAPTDHLWQANLPNALAPGSHVLTVRTTDMFGRTYFAKRVFVVEQ